MDRRGFVKTVAATTAACLAPRAGAAASLSDANHDDELGVLVDVTRCMGCRMCEAACAEANGLPEPTWDDDVDDVQRPTAPGRWAVVNRRETTRGDVWVRSQCMHCNEPACAAACLTKALVKTEEGPVVWREDKCMGCRYCMVACPFDVPKFEYESANPKIQKCRMCWERLQEGEQPACVENCPAGALTFGKRGELLSEAHARIATDPETYVDHVYGEREVGGTGWMYLSPVPFEELGMRTDLGTTSYPEYTRDFLTAVPVVLTLWPVFLAGLRQAHNEREADDAAEPASTSPRAPALQPAGAREVAS